MKLYALIWRLVFTLGFIAFLAAAPFLKVALTADGSMEAPLILMGHGVLATFGLAVWLSVPARPSIYARSRIWLHLLLVLSFILVVYQQVGFEASWESEYWNIVEPRTRVLLIWLPYLIPTALAQALISIRAFRRRRICSQRLAGRARFFELRYTKRVAVLILKLPPLIFLSLGTIVYLGEAAMSGRTFAEILDVELQVQVMITCSIIFLLFFDICDRIGGVLSAAIFIVGFGCIAFFGEPSVAEAWSSGRMPWQVKAITVVYCFMLAWILLDSLFFARFIKGFNRLLTILEDIRSL